MRKKTQIAEYYCVAVQRNYEDVWRLVSKHDTLEAAQLDLEERRAYTGSFNYDNATLRVISRTQAKLEFGADWEYSPIGSVSSRSKSATS
jgi:hypothetical protein